MDTKELILTSCEDSQQWSVCLWDYTSLNALHYYKNGGTVSAKTLQILGNDYILTADKLKPLIQVWPLNSQEPVKKYKIILPEKANCLAICPRNAYLAAGIETKLYIWHIASGKLFMIQKKNYQRITCIKFSCDGNFLVVTGEDGLLIVYDFCSLVASTNNYLIENNLGQIEPIYTKCDHSLAITDLFIGGFARKSRLVTASIDQTCKLYDLTSGQLLLNLVFDEPLSAVIFDLNCWNLFIGTNTGMIQQFYLKNPPRQQLEHHISKENNKLIGHNKKIVCLELNMTNTILISGSLDNYVFIWNIKLKQILKKIEHKAPITNIKCVLNYSNFFQRTINKPKIIMRSLNKDFKLAEDDFVDFKLQDDYDIQLSDDNDGLNGKELCSFEEIQAENIRLKCYNKQLYDVALQISKKYNNYC